MRRFFNSIIILLLLSGFISAQGEDEVFVVTGDSLSGKILDGQNVRVVNGNVHMTQGNVLITCDKAIQFLRSNSAELTGNVVITQDSLRILTSKGYYEANRKTAYSFAGLTLYNGKMKLVADTGYYYANRKKAFFRGEVHLQDTTNQIFSDKLTYFKNENKAVAVGRVKVMDTASVVYSDSLIHFRDAKITYGFRNIRIVNEEQSAVVTGDYLEDNGQTNTTIVSGNAFFTQIDTAENGTIDTLYISSKKMTAVADSTERIIAEDSVKILRGIFSGRNSKSVYYRNEEKIFIQRQKNEKEPPVMWYEYTQLSGDSIYIYLKKNELQQIDIHQNAFILSKNEDYLYRFDQISGDRIKMFFENRKLNRTEVKGNVLSIYYMFEKEEPNGLLKSSARDAKIIFENNTIVDVRLYGSPISEYHPENLIVNNEQSFTLPKFVIYGSRPEKEKLLKNRK